jgi:hypothetical protein
VRKVPDTSEVCDNLSMPLVYNFSHSLSQIESVFEGKTPRKFISESSELYADLCEI